MKLNAKYLARFFSFMVIGFGVCIAINAQTNTTQKPKLPFIEDFKKGFPTHQAYPETDDLTKVVGGAVLRQYQAEPDNDNSCALRVSVGLIESDYIIPYIKKQTFSGNEDKFYFLGASDFIGWLRDKYKPTVVVNLNDEMRNDPNLLAKKIGNKEGIYGMLPVAGRLGNASGHMDLFFKSGNEYKCENYCYSSSAATIYFWELPKRNR